MTNSMLFLNLGNVSIRLTETHVRQCETVAECLMSHLTLVSETETLHAPRTRPMTRGESLPLFSSHPSVCLPLKT